jgi:membrane-associated phospholipid phosphatase
VIGPGAFTNFALKKPFNRHRPHEIQRYDKNSELAFVKVFNIGKNDSSNSFTSGHAGAAFFFLVPWFIGRLRSKYGWKILLPALFWGGFVSTIRILQGNHFFSDCLGSLVVVYLTGLLLSHVCRVYST